MLNTAFNEQNKPPRNITAQYETRKENNKISTIGLLGEEISEKPIEKKGT